MNLICPNGHENPWESLFGWIRGEGSPGDHLESQGTNKMMSKFRKGSLRILTGLELGWGGPGDHQESWRIIINNVNLSKCRKGSSLGYWQSLFVALSLFPSLTYPSSFQLLALLPYLDLCSERKLFLPVSELLWPCMCIRRHSQQSP